MSSLATTNLPDAKLRGDRLEDDFLTTDHVIALTNQTLIFDLREHSRKLIF